MLASARIAGIRALAGLITAILLPIPAFAQPKIIFIGDSVTRGAGATNPETNGFVGQLSERFPELLVANAGCSGSTVRDWTRDGPSPGCLFLGAWNLLVEPELPAQITHIMLGTNDALGLFERLPDGSMGRWVSSEEYASRLRALVERAPGLVLISSPPKNPARLSGPVDDRLRGYRDAIDAIVGDYRYAAHGVDFYALLDPDNDLLGLHPNDRGHARMADELERRILHLLPRGGLSPCGNAVACGLFRLLPQHHHPRGHAGRVGSGMGTL